MLDFLATATVADVAEKEVARKGGPRKQRNPEGLAIRVFRDGSVYPSAALTEAFQLEYRHKENKTQGNGFDVIDTSLYPVFQVGKRILIISPIVKTAPKVDLFSSVGYDDEGVPLSSVMEQGSKTYGKDDLVPMIEEIYGIKFFVPAVVAKAAEGDKPAVVAQEEQPGVQFVDMELIANPTTGEPWGLPNGKNITYIPKKVARGEAKGTISTIRRENPAYYAFIPAAVVNEAAQNEAAEETVDAGQPVAEKEGELVS